MKTCSPSFWGRVSNHPPPDDDDDNDDDDDSDDGGDDSILWDLQDYHPLTLLLKITLIFIT
jgi:hypothetical protein